MKIDSALLIEECVEIISMHKNKQCAQKETETSINWYLRVLTMLEEIRREPNRNAARDRAEGLIKALNELISEERIKLSKQH